MQISLYISISHQYWLCCILKQTYQLSCGCWATHGEVHQAVEFTYTCARVTQVVPEGLLGPTVFLQGHHCHWETFLMTPRMMDNNPPTDVANNTPVSQAKVGKVNWNFKAHLKLTIIDSIAQIAFPSPLVQEADKRVDVRPAGTASHNNTGSDHWQLLERKTFLF